MSGDDGDCHNLEVLLAFTEQRPGGSPQHPTQNSLSQQRIIWCDVSTELETDKP